MDLQYKDIPQHSTNHSRNGESDFGTGVPKHVEFTDISQDTLAATKR